MPPRRENHAAHALQERAKLLLEKMRVGARRAFVIELTGTPKSGKTTTLGMLQSFFKASGFKVATLRERAADCPLPMKGHFFFNAWTTCTMLAEVLATFETNVDLLILDRGFFDALVWLELQTSRYQVEPREERVFAEFVLLDRWRSLVDMTLVMTVAPKVALKREDGGTLLPRRGSMMNERALGDFNQALTRATKSYGHRFKIVTRDTSRSRNPHRSSIQILRRILPAIDVWADRQVLVVPRRAIDDLFGRRTYLHSRAANPALRMLRSSARSMARYLAEKRDDVVQLVACGIVVHDEDLFVFSRSMSDEKWVTYGRRLLWKGKHIENVDGFETRHAATQLAARLQEDLHLCSRIKPEFLGLAWGSGLEPEPGRFDTRHLGVFFRVPVHDGIAQTLEAKEFRKAGRGHTQEGRFSPQAEIVRTADSLDLEPWSDFIVRNIQVGR